MKTDYILSPWRARQFDYYTLYYRISMDNVVRAEHIKSANNTNEYWLTMNHIDKSLEKDGYILCSSEEQFDKYKILA